jgi:hypothetical protein
MACIRWAVALPNNRDGRPDVYFACHGVDASPFPGEQPRVLLSQPDGTYKNVTIPITCYCHGASAADINGDGQLVSEDASYGVSVPQ